VGCLKSANEFDIYNIHRISRCYENSEHWCAFVPAILKRSLDARVGFPLFQPEIRRAGVIWAGRRNLFGRSFSLIMQLCAARLNEPRVYLW